MVLEKQSTRRRNVTTNALRDKLLIINSKRIVSKFKSRYEWQGWEHWSYFGTKLIQKGRVWLSLALLILGPASPASFSGVSGFLKPQTSITRKASFGGNCTKLWVFNFYSNVLFAKVCLYITCPYSILNLLCSWLPLLFIPTNASPL